MRMLSSVSGISLEKLSPATVDMPSTKPREVAPFLRSLRKMLENESEEILRWTPDGRAFEILEMDRMMNEVLPKYFKHRKYTSFQRQLNYFSFKKWTKSKAVVCTFSNDCFLRDRPDLSWRITRKKSVHTGGSSTPRKPRPAAVAVSKPRVKLEPVKLEPVKLEARPLPPKSPWKRDIAIRVPSSVLLGGTYSNGRQFPSPTDMDAMLMENDAECQKYQSSSNFTPLPLSEQEVDSLEWIDNFLPSLEMAPPRQEVLVFAGNTVNVSAGAFSRAAQYQFPSLHPGDYTCLTSM
ncbi:Heat stress transcription factor A-8 [Phytophthora citrophthora]|uniref:Heat stress transcription factor A-8 n=1 Tax=Phytophthora citrophthora TaxID=4793 RepID=A0AAD9LP92_9STRA|nr:Heat stress transcription factor A-8 [Phytophthora citrophthora]